jgi:hypothetical protein
MTLGHMSIEEQIYVESCVDKETVLKADKTQTAPRNTYRRECKRFDIDLVCDCGIERIRLCFAANSKMERRKGRNICRLSILLPRSVLRETRLYRDSVPRTLHIEDNTSKENCSKDDTRDQKGRGCLVWTTGIQAVINNLPYRGLTRMWSITDAGLQLRVGMVDAFRKRIPIAPGQTPSSECRPEQTRQQ